MIELTREQDLAAEALSLRFESVEVLGVRGDGFAWVLGHTTGAMSREYLVTLGGKAIYVSPRFDVNGELI